jgi:ABC-type tungstate transport system substrate-binding protein
MNRKDIKNKIISIIHAILYCSLNAIFFIILIAMALDFVIEDIKKELRKIKERKDEH